MRIVHYIAWFMLGVTGSLFYLTATVAMPNSKYTYLVKVRTPSEMNQLESWQCFYKGERLIFHGNLAKLTEKRCIFSFSLVITPEIRCTQRTILSSLRHIELKPGEPVRWFDLNLVFDDGLWKWNIIELTAENIPTIVPHHALIFLYDPTLVRSLEHPYKVAYCMDTFHEGGLCNFELPTIILDGSKEEIQNALNYAPNAAIDVLPYHCPSGCATRIIEGIHCAIDVAHP